MPEDPNDPTDTNDEEGTEETDTGEDAETEQNVKQQERKPCEPRNWATAQGLMLNADGTAPKRDQAASRLSKNYPGG